MRIKTNDGWYVQALHGVFYVTWVSEKDKNFAADFPTNNVDGWIDVLEDMTGKELCAVDPFS